MRSYEKKVNRNRLRLREKKFKVGKMEDDLVLRKNWTVKPVGKSPIGKPGHRWDIRTCFQEVFVNVMN